MSSKRLLARIPHAKVYGTGVVMNHTLRFHKISQIDGSGKCDIYKTNKSGSSIRGVLYKISLEDKKMLDEIEGIGIGYKDEVVSVVLENNEKKEAFTYYAITIDPLLKPLHWYKEHVIRGAIENKLPADYIAKIKRVDSVADSDTVRHEREMAFYR